MHRLPPGSTRTDTPFPSPTLFRSDGILEAGTPAPKDLALTENLLIPAGVPLPVPVPYSSTDVPPDVTINGGQFVFEDEANPVVLAADWVVSQGLNDVYAEGWGRSWRSGQTVPAGTPIIYIFGNNAANVSLPSAVFPNGLKLMGPVRLLAPEGSVPTSATTIAARS